MTDTSNIKYIKFLLQEYEEKQNHHIAIHSNMLGMQASAGEDIDLTELDLSSLDTELLEAIADIAK